MADLRRADDRRMKTDNDRPGERSEWVGPKRSRSSLKPFPDHSKIQTRSALICFPFSLFLSLFSLSLSLTSLFPTRCQQCLFVALSAYHCTHCLSALPTFPRKTPYEKASVYNVFLCCSFCVRHSVVSSMYSTNAFVHCFLSFYRMNRLSVRLSIHLSNFPLILQRMLARTHHLLFTSMSA